MARQSQVATKHFEEALVCLGGPEADRMCDRPPEQTQPPQPEREAEHERRRAHHDGVATGEPGQQDRFRQRLGERRAPAFSGRDVVVRRR